MASSFVLKRLGASNLVTRSVINSFRPTVAVSSRRSFTQLTVPERIITALLNHIPHTLYTTARIRKAKPVGMYFPKGGDDPTAFLREGLRFSINIPGAKPRYTTDGLILSIDLGLGENNTDFNFENAEAKYDRTLNALFIKGYVFKDGLCRKYNARVDLGDTKHCIGKPIKTKIVDGILHVLFSWKKED